MRGAGVSWRALMGRCVLTLALAAAGAGLAPEPPAAASVTPARITAMRWAVHQAGKWYCYGGTSGCFDCSGLVWAAYRHAGITLPRTSYLMAAATGRHLRRIPLSQARRGDILLYGTGHVELKTIYYHVSYGALQSGTRLGWHHWGGWWRPTGAVPVTR